MITLYKVPELCIRKVIDWDKPQAFFFFFNKLGLRILNNYQLSNVSLNVCIFVCIF